ncbi:hypothetical protein V491_02555, partial [Pseudogymnoascus sp. VKM F-3775]
MSTALATVTRSGVKRADSWGSSASPQQGNKSYPPPTPLLTIPPARHDSGYATNSDDDDFSESESEAEVDFNTTPVAPLSKKKGKTNTTHLEFSNYAHVDLTRRGSAGGKHWDFEYWGVPYSWKREGESYHLVPSSSSNGGAALAHIVPDVLTPSEKVSEARQGGWIPR